MMLHAKLALNSFPGGWKFLMRFTYWLDYYSIAFYDHFHSYIFTYRLNCTLLQYVRWLLKILFFFRLIDWHHLLIWGKKAEKEKEDGRVRYVNGLSQLNCKI